MSHLTDGGVAWEIQQEHDERLERAERERVRFLEPGCDDRSHTTITVMITELEKVQTGTECIDAEHIRRFGGVCFRDDCLHHSSARSAAWARERLPRIK